MTNKEVIEVIKKLVEDEQIFKAVSFTDTERQALDLAIKALEKDKCSSCRHYDKDYGETCLNPSGTCRVFEYDRYEEAENE